LRKHAIEPELRELGEFAARITPQIVFERAGLPRRLDALPQSELFLELLLGFRQ
jgi:hypothetical protein